MRIFSDIFQNNSAGSKFIHWAVLKTVLVTRISLNKICLKRNYANSIFKLKAN